MTRFFCNKIAVPPKYFSYGKFGLLPYCAVESDFRRGWTDVARKVDAGFWAADVPLARQPSCDSDARNCFHYWLLPRRDKDAGYGSLIPELGIVPVEKPSVLAKLPSGLQACSN